MMKFSESLQYKKYLNEQAHFNNYNSSDMEKLKQEHSVTLLATYEIWKTKFNRITKKDTKAYRVRASEKEDSKIIPVFDISQTKGKDPVVKPLTCIISPVKAYVPDYFKIMTALQPLLPLDIKIDTLHEKYSIFMSNYESENGLSIIDGMTKADDIATAIHEIIKARLKNIHPLTPQNILNIEAEAVSYVVCNYLGIDTASRSFGYIAIQSFNDPKLTLLNNSLENIKKTSENLITVLESKSDNISSLPSVPTRLPGDTIDYIEYQTKTKTEEIAEHNFELSEISLKVNPTWTLIEKYYKMDMPDPGVDLKKWLGYNFAHNNILPIGFEKMAEFFEAGYTVYALREDGFCTLYHPEEDEEESVELWGIEPDTWGLIKYDKSKKDKNMDENIENTTDSANNITDDGLYEFAPDAEINHVNFDYYVNLNTKKSLSLYKKETELPFSEISLYIEEGEIEEIYNKLLIINHSLNEMCIDFIETCIKTSQNTKNPKEYKIEAAVKKVIENYGEERVSHVLKTKNFTIQKSLIQAFTNAFLKLPDDNKKCIHLNLKWIKREDDMEKNPGAYSTATLEIYNIVKSHRE